MWRPHAPGTVAVVHHMIEIVGSRRIIGEETRHSVGGLQQRMTALTPNLQESESNSGKRGYSWHKATNSEWDPRWRDPPLEVRGKSCELTGRELTGANTIRFNLRTARCFGNTRTSPVVRECLRTFHRSATLSRHSRRQNGPSRNGSHAKLQHNDILQRYSISRPPSPF